MMGGKVQGPAPKSAAQTLAENAAFLMVATFLGAVLAAIVTWIFAPLQWTTGITTEKLEEDMARRIKARDARNELYDLDTKDPMHQFQERYIKNPGRNFSLDDDAYLHWYTEWVAGRILDSQLRWAPEISWDISSNFINYLAAQVELHKMAPSWRRSMLLGTIKRFYPEFQPTMAGLEEDIEAYGAEADGRECERELATLFGDCGLPESTWDYLMGLPTEQLKEKMEYLRDVIGQGADSDVAMALCDAGIPYDADSNLLATEILETLRLPGKVVGMVLKKSLSMEELRGLTKRMQGYYEMYGVTDKKHRDGHFDQYLLELTESKRAIKYTGKLAW